MRFILILGLAGALAGCQTTDDRIAQDDRQCQSYGVAPGSPGYVQCRANLDTNRANVRAAQGFGTSGGLVGFIERSTEK